MSEIVRTETPEPRVVVSLSFSEAYALKELAHSQAEETKNWYIVNTLHPVWQWVEESQKKGQKFNRDAV